MKTQHWIFFNTPNGKKIPFVPKCGIVSLAHMLHNYEKGAARKKSRHHESKDILLPVRNPVERFTSAIWQVNKNKPLTVDEALDCLENGRPLDGHFKRISDILECCEGCRSVKLYRFPDHFQEMIKDAGLNYTDTRKNASTDKPILTNSQAERVAEYYKNDMNLFNSIEHAGQKFLLPFA
jgi:hypothetical protein